MAELKAPRKAIIFTESRRTQEYLFRFLSANGHAGKLVLFSGTNNHEYSTAIYQRWLEEYKDTDRVTGSPQVDRRTALIDHFRKDEGTGAEIMIATEAAAEGVNLQFCSLIINYDLPWNPQRVEQRIGRCHRYGQRFDVVVINFLNTRNQADQRVLELLTEKFNLFSGVFGASDEVLVVLKAASTSKNASSRFTTPVASPSRSKPPSTPCKRNWKKSSPTASKTPSPNYWRTSMRMFTTTSNCGFRMPKRGSINWGAGSGALPVLHWTDVRTSMNTPMRSL